MTVQSIERNSFHLQNPPDYQTIVLLFPDVLRPDVRREDKRPTSRRCQRSRRGRRHHRLVQIIGLKMGVGVKAIWPRGPYISRLIAFLCQKNSEGDHTLLHNPHPTPTVFIFVRNSKFLFFYSWKKCSFSPLRIKWKRRLNRDFKPNLF